DVAVIELDLPGLDGLSAAETLHKQLPSCRTLVLTGLSQPGNLLRALKVHVRGFLLKDAPAPELANAIRSVAAGCPGASTGRWWRRRWRRARARSRNARRMCCARRSRACRRRRSASGSTSR